MFAVIRTGGKQYKVAPNDVIRVERLPGGAGDILELGEVLMLGGDGGNVTVGAPLVSGACVGASVIAQAQGDKVLVFKKKRRHNHRRKNGHRQELTILRITEILTDGQKPSKQAAAEAAPAPAKKAKKAPIKKTVTEGGARPKAAARKAAKPKAAKAKSKE